MIIAVIPARKGSKRIKNKNIKLFLGKPIIDYSISEAKKSRIFKEIIVSTNSIKILKHSIKLGAKNSFIRAEKISDDKTGILEVMHDAAKLIKKKYKNIKYLCCIFAASPLIKSIDLRKAFSEIKTGKFDYVFSATNYSYPIERAFKIKKNKIKMINKNNYKKKSQFFDETYHDAGQFYFGKIESWLKKKIIFSKNSKIIKLPNWRVQDIDVKDDWKRAENLYKIR
jgi:N-acylneuraminate cytidylyltransferase